MSRRLLPLVVAFSLVGAVAWAQTRLGSEFQVNSYTTLGQRKAAVASDVNGNFVVVWQSLYQDGSTYSVFGQRFNAAGLPQGSEFQVNSYTTGYQTNPAVASAANGSFVVVWNSYYQDGSNYGIFGQRFSAAGLPQGSEFQINSYTTGSQYRPSAASDVDGNFVVVWSSSDQVGNNLGVFGQRFSAAGVPQGSEFQVNSYTTGYKNQPAVSLASNGDFVVVWSSYAQDGSEYGVFGQRFNAAGLPQGSEFQVNSYTTYSQINPAVTSAADGSFVVVWDSYGQDGSTVGIFGQRFNAAGLPQGSEFQVNSYTTDYQNQPAVSSASNGAFVVVWNSYGQDGSTVGVFGQRFSAAGLPQGSEFQVNSYTTNYQNQPAVSSASNGAFVVVWNSYGQDGGGYGVFGQRYDVDRLTVSKTGAGTGVVTSSPPGINCGVDCTEAYAFGTGVTLTATADANSTFAGWTGGGCTGVGTCVLTFSAAVNITAGFVVKAAGDFDGDGKSDVLWRHATLGEVWLWPMNGAARTSETFIRAVPDTDWEIRGQGDQNGDGRADMLWRNKTTGQIYLWPNDGTTLPPEIYVATVDPAYDIVGTGDYNGDGKSDILWRQLTTGDVWIWLMEGPTPLSEVYVETVDPGYAVVGSGDLNGDAKGDIVWHHGTLGEVWVWLMNGTTPLSQTLVATVPDVGYQIVGVADYTGDAKADILWHHATRGEVWLWPMNGTTVVSESFVDTVSDTGYEIVGTGDYNGDRKADILWHHATRGEVWMWLMDGPSTLSETWVATVPDVGYQVAKVK
jgi:hypothetical protein